MENNSAMIAGAEKIHFLERKVQAPGGLGSHQDFLSSRSSQYAVVAVGETLGRGVDIEERTRCVHLTDGMRQHYFSEQELREFAPDKNFGFLTHWTGKEAIVKVHRVGLNVALSKVNRCRLAHVPLADASLSLAWW